MNLVFKVFPIETFDDYIWSLTFNGWTPNFIVTHNTSVPSQKLFTEWHERKNWTFEQWLKNLASYYAGQGFKGCPHFFVGYDKIGVLNDPRYPGTHSPSWNKFTWGVETVGEFETEPFDNGVKKNLIATLAILHTRIGLNPADFKLGVRGLHFHKEDKLTSHRTCPGRNLVKSTLIADVVRYMNVDQDQHIHITEAAQIADTSKLTDEELIDIKWLQLNLNAKCNAGLKVDGKVGNMTKEAVKAFQKIMKLKFIDGIAGPVTRLALKNYNVASIKGWK